jgi:hypothetical protein
MVWEYLYHGVHEGWVFFISCLPEERNLTHFRNIEVFIQKLRQWTNYKNVVWNRGYICVLVLYRWRHVILQVCGERNKLLFHSNWFDQPLIYSLPSRFRLFKWMVINYLVACANMGMGRMIYFDTNCHSEQCDLTLTRGEFIANFTHVALIVILLLCKDAYGGYEN